MSNNNGVAHQRNDNGDLDAEFKRLEERKQVLKRLLALKREVDRIEAKALTHMDSSVKLISEVVASDYGITFEQLQLRSRMIAVVLPRQIVFHLALQLTDHGYGAVGRMFGKNYGTVTCGVSSIKNRMYTDPAFKERITRLETECGKRMQEIERTQT